MVKHNIQDEVAASQEFFAKFRPTRSVKLARWKASYYAQNHPGRRRGSAWKREEIDMILAREIADRFLAKNMQRSISAIQTRRARCNKLISQGMSPYEK